jgi:CubicO group peptidase (beta-lactamase class C family)
MNSAGRRYVDMKTRTLSALLLILALFTAVSAQTLDKAKLDQFFDRLAEKNKAMGSLTVAKEGNVLYTRAIGFSEINGTGKKPATSATRYRIGSISKMFTAVMVLQLVEEGKLKLTDTLDKFFPQIPNANKITLAQVLGHRSGIYNVTEDPSFPTWKSNAKTPAEMIALVAKGKPTFEPGEKYGYSNSNYLALGYIVEKVTGKPYQIALKERITSKLGLKDTYFGTGMTEVSKNEGLSYRYARDWDQVSETHMSVPGGAGAVISTPNDLVKFIEALFALKLVSQESLNQMMQNKMGMNTYPLDGKTTYGHGGSIDGFRSLLVYLPEEKLAMAYTSNGVNYPSNDIVVGVFDIYRNKPFTIPTFETVAVKPEVLDKYVGVYSTDDGSRKLTISRDGDTLQAQPGSSRVVALEATAEATFKYDPAGIVLEFDTLKNQMTLKQRGRNTVFTKETGQ